MDTREVAIAVAIIGLVGVVVAALAGLAGAFLGSWIAAREARHARMEARSTRFHDDLRLMATTLYQTAERHRKDREAQWARWVEVADGGLDVTANPIPQVSDTESVFDAAVALDLVATRPTTVAAWNLYGATIRLDDPAFAYDAVRHTDGSTIEGPSAAERADFRATMRSHVRRAWEFTNAIRDELGIDRLPEWDPSEDPDDAPVHD